MVGKGLPPISMLVESAFGSHPICITLYPRLAKAADTLAVVVDFPIPPLPYIAIFFNFGTPQDSG